MDVMDGMDHGQHTAIRWPHRHTSRRYTLQRFAVALRAPPSEASANRVK
jgi:hypothetical protein